MKKLPKWPKQNSTHGTASSNKNKLSWLKYSSRWEASTFKQQTKLSVHKRASPNSTRVSAMTWRRQRSGSSNRKTLFAIKFGRFSHRVWWNWLEKRKFKCSSKTRRFVTPRITSQVSRVLKISKVLKTRLMTSTWLLWVTATVIWKSTSLCLVMAQTSN